MALFLSLIFLPIIFLNLIIKADAQDKGSSNQIKEILDWAKANKIIIHPNMVLKKNPKRFDFSVDKNLKNNTLLLSVPFESVLHSSGLIEFFKSSKNKFLKHLWEKILPLTDINIAYYPTKQLFYLGVIMENAYRRKKGYIYDKFKTYFDMLQELSLDDYPIFYPQSDFDFLQFSFFGKRLLETRHSLDEELEILSRELGIKTANPDDYSRFRLFALSNSIFFNDTTIKKDPIYSVFNDTIMVPFIDCFEKTLSPVRYNVRYEVVKGDDGKYKIDFYTTKEIFKDTKLLLEWTPMPNADFLMFFGSIEEGNPLVPTMKVEVLNDKIRDLKHITRGYPFLNETNNIYDLKEDFLSYDLVALYRRISAQLYEYQTKQGRFEVMRDNLKAYYEIYEEEYTDGKINEKIFGAEKIKKIKSVLNIEKLFLDRRIGELDRIIAKVKEGTYEPLMNETNERYDNAEEFNHYPDITDIGDESNASSDEINVQSKNETKNLNKTNNDEL